jgi:two-component system LytT family sensor kinase
MPAAAAPIDLLLAADIFGFFAGLVVTVLLLWLTLRAAKLPGCPGAHILFAICALAWNAGGLGHVFDMHDGKPHPEQGLGLLFAAIQFTGAAIWPIPMLSIWHPYAARRWQQLASRALLCVAVLHAGIILAALWGATLFNVRVVPFEQLATFAAYNASTLLALGAIVQLKGAMTSRAVWFSAITMLFGVFGSTLAVILAKHVAVGPELQAALRVVAKQSVLIGVLGAFFLFARFRFADVFIRHSIRIALASGIAIILVLTVEAMFHAPRPVLAPYPHAIRLVAVSLLAAAVLLSFTILDRGMGLFVDRWILRAPDYRAATRALAETLRQLRKDDEIAAAVETCVRYTLELDDVRTIRVCTVAETFWPPEMYDGEVIALEKASPLRLRLSLPELEFLVPVRTGGQVTSVLAISPGPQVRALVSDDISWVRSAAVQFGSRLDALRAERELLERQSRESLLLQQVTEAELRALRAQINPHFLFNALNTIADLIVTNPSQAEAMTLRLSKVFRHVLARSSQPLTSVREEMAFLRTYLDIEEARFGTRLQVHIEVAAEVAQEPIPSLILQPLVENALKHGLAPKPGQGHLWITARAQGRHVCVHVEDDGIGLSATGPRRDSLGVGLSNIAQRLSTFYQGRARVALEPRESGGTRVTLLVPRGPAQTDVMPAAGVSADIVSADIVSADGMSVTGVAAAAMAVEAVSAETVSAEVQS